MNVDEKISYWIDMAEYDLETAKAMHSSKRYLYVGFMCHQVIEKTLKGYYWKVLKEEPPYIHNLSILSKKSGIFKELNNDQTDFMDYLEPLNIRGRYPRDKAELLSELNDEKSFRLITKTEELYIWMRQLLTP